MPMTSASWRNGQFTNVRVPNIGLAQSAQAHRGAASPKTAAPLTRFRVHARAGPHSSNTRVRTRARAQLRAGGRKHRSSASGDGELSISI
jgi:hypothetical protein